MKFAMPKFYLLLLSLLFVLPIIAQEKVELNNQDGVYVSYELTKLSAGDKKDRYLIVVKAQNKNDFDVFYSLPMTRQANGSYALNALVSPLFSDVLIRNSTGLFGNGVRLTATQTQFLTNDNSILYKLEKGQIINSETEFNVKKDDKPIITNSFLKSLKKLDAFNLAINESMINGDWIASCGNIQMSLSLQKNEKGEMVISQSVNGRTNTWKKLNANVFEKDLDKNASLSFNKNNNTFTYTHTDGVSCTWVKK